MRNDGLDELQAGIKIGERKIHNLRYADDTTLMAESIEELKSLLMRMKEESERPGLKIILKKLIPWHLAPLLHGKEWGKGGSRDRFPLLGKSLWMVTAAMISENV